MPAFSLQISSVIKEKKLNIIEKIRWKMLAVGNWLGMGFVDGWHLQNCTNSAVRF